MTQKPRLGELLISHNVITAEQFKKVVEKQQAEGGKISHLLVDMGFVDEETLLRFLSQQLDIPFVDLKHYELNPDLVHRLSESFSRRSQVILLDETEQGFLVGMVDPQDIIASDELSRLLKRPLKLALVRESDWLTSIDAMYRHSEEISAYAKELSEEVGTETKVDSGQSANLEEAYEAPVTKLLQSIFRDAMQMRASDIHIEPDELTLRIRQRIDGVLHEREIAEKGIAPALSLRLKLMGGLKIAERRLPQDGRFSITIHGKEIDVRLSTMPVQYGESVVMRLLDKASINLNIEQLSISPSVLEAMKRLLKLPYGMILITGPTGSGKTSTLYAMLSELNDSETKIITVEDPVEYRLPRINQVQVHPQIGLTFASILRSALRQDPDVIMIGEIRDSETANIAMNAAMTGHFVLATMHTNDAVSSVTRLMEMENETYVVAAGLRAVMSQRLLRRICNECIKVHELDITEKMWLKKVMGERYAKVQFKSGAGCKHCFNTGFKGRVPIFELIEINDAIADTLTGNDLTAFSKAVKNTGYVTLLDSALALAEQGVTTVDEVLRVTATLSSLVESTE
ncbi:MAG TPA: GspE/PulE family protein [Gammaproteobacteria bacterium]|nr:GspE/PulE family protein [Gammaproteobacteria bacterium]